MIPSGLIYGALLAGLGFGFMLVLNPALARSLSFVLLNWTMLIVAGGLTGLLIEVLLAAAGIRR